MLTGAEKSEKSGRAKRLGDRWVNSQYGEVLLPFYDDTSHYPTNLSSRMSPAAKSKGQLTTSNIAGSGYLSMVEAGVFVHTCDKDYARHCAACLYNFWRHQFPIDELVFCDSEYFYMEPLFCDGEYFYMEGDYRPTRFEMNDKALKGKTHNVFRSRTATQKRDPRIPKNPESVEISK
jgi:hypothetical protein